MNNFILGPLDTDSISICKFDMTPMSESEQDALVAELNTLYPEKIRWTHDGYFSCVIVLRTKNYVLLDGKSLKIKGSALKSSKMEKALKEFQIAIIWEIINDTKNYKEVYHRYIREAMNITDIHRWASKKSISEKVLSSDRTNESKIRDAIKDTEYSEGDKGYFFFTEDNKLCLVENFNGCYDRSVMLRKLFNTAQIFENILDTKTLFLNYALKRNKKALETI